MRLDVTTQNEAAIFDERTSRLKRALELNAPPIIVAELARSVIEAYNGCNRDTTVSWLREKWRLLDAD